MLAYCWSKNYFKICLNNQDRPDWSNLFVQGCGLGIPKLRDDTVTQVFLVVSQILSFGVDLISVHCSSSIIKLEAILGTALSPTLY